MKHEVLRVQDICKSVSGKAILTNMKLNLTEGELLGLIGLQGAGKTTLVNIIAGLSDKDSGAVFLNGREVAWRRRREAERNGIFAVFENTRLIQNLSVADNLFVINDHSLKKIRLNKRIINEETKRLTRLIGLDIEPGLPASRVSLSQQYMIHILRAWSQDAKIIILDNIFSQLTKRDLGGLYHVLSFLKQNKVSVIVVAQDYEAVRPIAERIVVMRGGRHVKTLYPDEYDRKYIINLMVGYDFPEQYDKPALSKGNTVLSVQNLRLGRLLKSVSFSVHESEVVGLVGKDKDEIRGLLDLLAGFLPADSGDIYINAKRAGINTHKDAIRHGIGYISEDTPEQSLMQNLNIIDNLLFMVTRKTSRRFFRINTHIENMAFRELAPMLDLSYKDRKKSIALLSLRQKYLVSYAKWLLVRPALIVMDNPTKSADPVIKQVIFDMVKRFSIEGISLMIASPDIEDLLTLCDRILFLRDGEITGEAQSHEMTKNTIIHYFEEKLI